MVGVMHPEILKNSYMNNCRRCNQPSEEKICKYCEADYYQPTNLNNRNCPDCQDLLGILEYHDDTIKYVCKRCKFILSVDDLSDKVMSKTYARY